MAYAPYEFLWVVKESAYGTQKSPATAGVDSMYIRLAGANRFGMRPVPTKRKIPFGGGFAAAGYAKSDQWVVSGSLELELCYSQALMLLGWGITRINAGQTTPWTTTEPSGDLASCVVYHGVMRSDQTIRRRRYKAVKVTGGSLTSSADSGLVMLRLDLVAQKMDSNATDASSDPDATAFPAPADTAFPVDPLCFVHLTPTFNSTTVGYCQNLNLTWTNNVDARFFAGSPFISFARLRGRTSRATLGVLYTATPNWRSDFEALTSDDASFAFTDGVTTVTLDMKANNLVDELTDDLTPGRVYDQTVTLENQWDTAASNDLTVTVA